MRFDGASDDCPRNEIKSNSYERMQIFLRGCSDSRTIEWPLLESRRGHSSEKDQQNLPRLKIEAGSDVDLLLEIVPTGEDIIECIVSTHREAEGDVFADEVFDADVEAEGDGVGVEGVRVKLGPGHVESDERNPLAVIACEVVFREDSETNVDVAFDTLDVGDEADFPTIFDKPAVGEVQVVGEVISKVDIAGESELLGSFGKHGREFV